MNKVKLPREVAEALEKEIEDGDTDGDFEYIAWSIPRWALERGHRRTLFEFSANANCFFRLIDALRYGYEVELEPITVTITPEQQEKIAQYYANLDPDTQADAFDREFVLGERSGVRFTLEMLGITIPGIPRETPS